MWLLILRLVTGIFVCGSTHRGPHAPTVARNAFTMHVHENCQATASSQVAKWICFGIISSVVAWRDWWLTLSRHPQNHDNMEFLSTEPCITRNNASIVWKYPFESWGPWLACQLAVSLCTSHIEHSKNLNFNVHYGATEQQQQAFRIIIRGFSPCCCCYCVAV